MLNFSRRLGEGKDYKCPKSPNIGSIKNYCMHSTSPSLNPHHRAFLLRLSPALLFHACCTVSGTICFSENDVSGHPWVPFRRTSAVEITGPCIAPLWRSATSLPAGQQVSAGLLGARQGCPNPDTAFLMGHSRSPCQIQSGFSSPWYWLWYRVWLSHHLF